MRAPHLLPLYSPDIVVLFEILYQTFAHRVTSTLKREKWSIWPKFPIRIRYYVFDHTNQAMKEASEIESYHFGEIRFRKHDLEDLVISHYVVVNQMWSYTHERDTNEEIFKRLIYPLRLKKS